MDNFNLTQEKIDQMTIEQGIQVSQVLAMPGWKVIEAIIKQTEKEAIHSMRLDMKLQSTRERSIFWNGVICAANEVLENVFNAVSRAQELKAGNERRQQIEEDLNAQV